MVALSAVNRKVLGSNPSVGAKLNMKILDVNPHTAVCEQCKGKPDYVYANSENGEVLSIICNPCKEIIEATIKSMGQAQAGINNALH